MGRLYNAARNFVNDWIEPVCGDLNDPTISVIIPVYKPTHLDVVIQHLNKIAKSIEVVLVDDSGEDIPLQVGDNTDITIKLVRHVRNLGRPAARNTGAVYSSGEILVFIDQDMIIAPGFFEQATRLLGANNSKGVALGLRHTLPFEEIPLLDEWRYCSKENDWRISTPVLESFVDLTVSGVGSMTNKCNPHELLFIHQQTNSLRDLGVATEKTIGYWDLPSMVISHSMAIAKNEFFRIGGFPEWISGWGGEDIVIGFLAVAAGNPIMMTDSVSYHIQHPPYSGSEQQKIFELKRNIEYYRAWANNVDEFPIINAPECKKRGKLIDL